MRTLPFEVLLDWILCEYEEQGSIFGIPEEQFYRPASDPAYATDRLFGSHLTTPIGPAAGPHTQLTQNILSSWLCGGRFIELKTVQIMDELEIPRPCIDLADEGYNVEWSQELRLAQSVEEYVKAWALLPILRRILGQESTIPFGTIFNMSVGYNLEGIQSPAMQAFMDKMEDASSEIAGIRRVLEAKFPRFSDVEIPQRLVNSVTLSTMHGCPPDEIERIARYLLEERGLHTTVKLNPTLLGKDRVLDILHDRLGFHEIVIPDSVFEHDLGYGRAVELITALKRSAGDRDLTFGVKLSNTLAMANHRDILPGDEMYMSGRALFPVTVQLFEKLHREFAGDLNVSYSAGADAVNLPNLLAAGALPVTVASDLLKPGGYGRFGQYLETLGHAMAEAGAESLEDLAGDRGRAVSRLAELGLSDKRYKKEAFPHGLPKVSTPLETFDCIDAPCMEACAVCQDVPDYAWWLAQGDEDRALAAILARNPLPAVTGHICTNLCQTRCTRNNYDEPVAIRKLKRFAAEHGAVSLAPLASASARIAVIGSGPAGLAAAAYLALSGVSVTVFEAKDRLGGMLAIAPRFRLPEAVVQADIDRILALGVEIRTDHPISENPAALLTGAEPFDAVFIGCGFRQDRGLSIEGMDADGVYGTLEFLDRVAHATPPALEQHVVVIGGGNSAMDAARTAQRLTGRPTTVLYRRTRAEMPAEPEEIEDLLEEGNQLEELVSPVRILVRDGAVAGVRCIRNRLGDPGADGRRRPEPIDGSEFTVEAGTVLHATGQRSETEFLAQSGVLVRRDGTLVVAPSTGRAAEAALYAGGDIARGPETIIAACADGRRAAEAICQELGLAFRTVEAKPPVLSFDEVQALKTARTRKSDQTPSPTLPMDQRSGFDLIEGTFSRDEAKAEAARCLQCTTICDKCVEVCPNRANLALQVTPFDLRVPVVALVDGRLGVTAYDRVTMSQPRQILHLEDPCNHCGNCTTFCTHPGEPFERKPRLFFQRADFYADTGTAYYLSGEALHRRDEAGEHRILPSREGFQYETEAFSVRLSTDFELLEANVLKPFAGDRSLRPAAVMAALLGALRADARYVVQAAEQIAAQEGST